MTARDRILRDNGLLALAAALALTAAGNAAAGSRPDPHNFVKPLPHNFVHPSPHNFTIRRNAT